MKSVVEEFDGHFAAQRRIDGSIDVAHAAGPQPGGNGVLAEPVARGEQAYGPALPPAGSTATDRRGDRIALGILGQRNIRPPPPQVCQLNGQQFQHGRRLQLGCDARQKRLQPWWALFIVLPGPLEGIAQLIQLLGVRQGERRVEVVGGALMTAAPAASSGE